MRIFYFMGVCYSSFTPIIFLTIFFTSLLSKLKKGSYQVLFYLRTNGGKSDLTLRLTLVTV